jgi:hypothetical protein
MRLEALKRWFEEHWGETLAELEVEVRKVTERLPKKTGGN